MYCTHHRLDMTEGFMERHKCVEKKCEFMVKVLEIYQCDGGKGTENQK